MTQKLKLLLAIIWMLISLATLAYVSVRIIDSQEQLQGFKTDFETFYRSVKFWDQGKSLYAPSDMSYEFPKSVVISNHKVQRVVIKGVANGNLNSPVGMLMLLWTAKFNYQTALYIFLSLAFFSCLITCYLLNNKIYRKPFFSASSLAYLAMVFLYFPVNFNFRDGQVGLFIGLGVTLLWLALRKKQDVWAGILLGLLVSMKWFLGLLVIFIALQRRWCVLIASLVTALIGLMLTLVVFGKNAYWDFYSNLRGITYLNFNLNASFPGFLMRMLRNTPFSTLSPVVKNFSQHFFSGLISLTVIVLIVWLSWPTSRRPKRYFDVGFAFTLCACLFLSPLGWNYYFPMLFVAWTTLLRLAPFARYEKTIYLLAWCSLALSAYPQLIYCPVNHWLSGFNLWAANFNFVALSLFMLAIVLLRFTLQEKKNQLSSQFAQTKFKQYSYVALLIASLFPYGLYGWLITYSVS